MLALSLLDLVAYLIKDRLLALLANIKIDRSINRKLFVSLLKILVYYLY